MRGAPLAARVALAAVAAAALGPARAVGATPFPPDRYRLLPPARMGGFALRALWETRTTARVGDRERGEVWRAEAQYDFAPDAAPRDERGRPLEVAPVPGCPARADHGMPVTLAVTWAGGEPPPCGEGGEAVALGEGCGTWRENVGDKAHTEGAYALEWRVEGLAFLLTIGRRARDLPDARARLVAAAAEAGARARRVLPGAGSTAALEALRPEAEAALARGREESRGPARCREGG